MNTLKLLTLATGKYFSNINKLNWKIIFLQFTLFLQFLALLSKEVKKNQNFRGEKVQLELPCILVDLV